MALYSVVKPETGGGHTGLYKKTMLMERVKSNLNSHVPVGDDKT